MGERIRGRRGVELRKRRLRNEPLCRMCRAEGRVTVATVPDHIVPLALGGEDVDDNCQSLCADHHAEKTALEGNTFAASNHPDWLQPSAIPLTIVSGPPCSGKTTYVNDHAEQFDTIICLDMILAGLRPGYEHWTGTLDPTLLNKAVRLRNAKLNALSRATSGRAWFIVSAPTEGERAWWHAKLGGEPILLHPGVSECRRRAIQRGTPRAVEGINAWERASRSPWIPPQSRKARQTIGADGWPIQ